METETLNLSGPLKRGPLRRFLHFCSGAIPSIITRKECETEQIKYSCIGATVLCTGLMASLSGGYALHKVFGDQGVPVFIFFGNSTFSVPFSILFGMFWGLMIFNLDRYIVQSISKEDDIPKQLLNALPRIFLAVMLSLVITKPLELQIFDKEINGQLEQEIQVLKSDEENRQASSGASNEISRLATENQTLLDAIKAKETERSKFDVIAQDELDGTGGSTEEGPGPIYRAKVADAGKIQKELDELKSRNNRLVQSNDTRIAELNNQKADSVRAVVEAKRNADGLLGRLSALGKLTENDTTARWIEIGIILLFLALETAPVFAKVIAKRGPHDTILARLESEVFAQEEGTLEFFRSNIREETDHRITLDRESKSAARDNYQDLLNNSRTSPEYASAQSEVQTRTVNRMVEQLNRDLDRHFMNGGTTPHLDEEARRIRVESETEIKREIRKQIGIRRKLANFVNSAKERLNSLIGRNGSK